MTVSNKIAFRTTLGSIIKLAQDAQKAEHPMEWYAKLLPWARNIMEDMHTLELQPELIYTNTVGMATSRNVLDDM